ncbi:MAG TPA: site-2 protease family protein [Candidatus Deferrimicrobium sp.]|nr:site-2 protease family protein [Candidatus Deferrimicrobium sp.]
MDEYSYWEEEKSLSIEDLKKLIEKYFKVLKSFIAPGTGIPTFTIQPLDAGTATWNTQEFTQYSIKESFNALAEELLEYEYYPLLRRQTIGPLFGGVDRPLVAKGPEELILRLLPKKKEEPKRRRININLVLLIVTIGTVMGAAIFLLTADAYVNFVNNTAQYYYSLIMGYTIAIMCVIGIHETGHLVACRIHKIKSSYPYFIPFIPPLGTMGAVIIQKSPPRNKDELFDVGLTGPLFGFIIAVIVTIIGYGLTLAFTNSQIYSLTGATIEQLAGAQFPDPLLFRLVEQFMLSSIPYNVYITAGGGSMVYMLHIIAFAGWIGCFITGLNLFPIGQLDGGHVSRAIFGEKYYRYVSWVAFFAMILINWLMALLVLFLSRFSFDHPGPLNDVSPLSTSRKVGSIVFFVVLFLTVPLGSFWF